MRRAIYKSVPLIYQAGLLIGVVIGIGLVLCGCSQPVVSVPALKILVDQEGIYRISADQLSAAGMDIRSMDADRLQLSLRGIEQSLTVISDDDGMWLEFFGQQSDSLYSSENIYMLNIINHKSEYTQLINSEARETPAPSEMVSSVYMKIEHIEDNQLYFPQADGSEHWYLSAVTSGQQQTLPFVLTEQAPGEGVIRLDLWSNTEAPGDPDHHLLLKINGQLILDKSWDGKGGQQLTATIPTGILAEEENIVMVDIPGDTESEAEVVWINWYEISYPRYAVAEDEQFKFTVVNQPFILSGFRDWVHLYDITDTDRVIFQEAVNTLAGRLSFSGINGHTYYVVGAGGFRQPVLITPLADLPNRLLMEEGADYLAIGPEEFLSAADELLTHREAQGLMVMRVPLEGIFDHYGYGFPEPDAIKRFLVEATQNWKTNPRYVLLLGDASYDPRNYLKLGETNILPTYFVQTQYGGQTASDIPFADLSEDGIPDISVGRVPATSAEEVSIFARKTLEYETSKAGQAEEFRLLAIADGQDAGFQFDAQRFMDNFSLDTEKSLFAPEGGVSGANATIRAYFSDGYDVIAYFGHGSVVMWGKDQLFTVEDADKLTNSHYPVIINMTCLTGFFTHPNIESLTEALLFNPTGGAVAIMAPTSLTLPGDQSFLSAPLGEALDAEEFGRIGDIFLLAQSQMNTDFLGVQDVLATFLLFGDPGLVVFP